MVPTRWSDNASWHSGDEPIKSLEIGAGGDKTWRLRVAPPYPFLEPMEDANGMVLVMRINSRNYDIISSNGD